jgi:hypothetical protein
METEQGWNLKNLAKFHFDHSVKPRPQTLVTINTVLWNILCTYTKSDHLCGRRKLEENSTETPFSSLFSSISTSTNTNTHTYTIRDNITDTRQKLGVKFTRRERSHILVAEDEDRKKDERESVTLKRFQRMEESIWSDDFFWLRSLTRVKQIVDLGLGGVFGKTNHLWWSGVINMNQINQPNHRGNDDDLVCSQTYN